MSKEKQEVGGVIGFEDYRVVGYPGEDVLGGFYTGKVSSPGE